MITSQVLLHIARLMLMYITTRDPKIFSYTKPYGENGSGEVITSVYPDDEHKRIVLCGLQNTYEPLAFVKVFDLKYANAKDVQNQLKAQIDAKKVGTVKADERTNQIILRALPERVKEIEGLIVALDKRPEQVLIDTRIVKVKLSNARTTGIEWEGLFSMAKGAGLTYFGSYPFSMLQSTSEDWMPRRNWYEALGQQVGSYPGSGTTDGYTGSRVVAPGKNMHVGMVTNDQDFDVLINYLDTIGETKILSNPTISVINNQEARIHVGERQAYVTTTTTTGAKDMGIFTVNCGLVNKFLGRFSSLFSRRQFLYFSLYVTDLRSDLHSLRR